jgi:hypothetical protein
MSFGTMFGRRCNQIKPLIDFNRGSPISQFDASKQLVGCERRLNDDAETAWGEQWVG